MTNNYLKIITCVVFINILNTGYALADAVGLPPIIENVFCLCILLPFFIIIIAIRGIKYIKNQITEKNMTNQSGVSDNSENT